jgi:hypothetical protein
VNDFGGEGLVALFRVVVVTCCISVPLGLWKLVEILAWVWARVHFGVGP